MRRLLSLALASVAVSCGLWENAEYGRVQQGSFRTTFTETGELQSVRYTLVNMPSFDWSHGQPKIVFMAEEGLTVREGDIVGRVDTGTVEKVLRQKEAELQIARGELDRLDTQHANKRREMDGRLRSLQGGLRRARIDTQRTRFESATRHRASKLRLRNAELNLRKLEAQIGAVGPVQKEERFIQVAKNRQIQAAIDKALRAIENFTLRAPAGGLIEHRRKRWGTRAKIQIGDQLHPGHPIIGLPDLSRMKVLTSVAETDIDKVKVDQRVEVRLDAYPKVAFSGSVTFISRISRWKERAKVFDVELALDETDPMLRPGMTVSAEFTVVDLTDALFVDGNCLYKEGGAYALYVKRLLGVDRVPVGVPYRNPEHAVVKGKISAGDRLVRRGQREDT